MFNPTHVLKTPGYALILVELSPQDGTAPWFKLYTELDTDGLLVLGADGKVRNSYTGEVVDGATVERMQVGPRYSVDVQDEFDGGSRQAWRCFRSGLMLSHAVAAKREAQRMGCPVRIRGEIETVSYQNADGSLCDKQMWPIVDEFGGWKHYTISASL